MEDNRLDADKVRTFWDKLYKLAEQEFERDCDGDLPIQIQVIDRTRFMPDHYFRIPYTHKAETSKELVEIGGYLMDNVKSAIEALQQFYRAKEYEERRIQQEAERRKP